MTRSLELVCGVAVLVLWAACFAAAAGTVRLYSLASRIPESGHGGLLMRHVTVIGTSYLLAITVVSYTTVSYLRVPWTWPVLPIGVRVVIVAYTLVSGLAALVLIAAFEHGRVSRAMAQVARHLPRDAAE